MIRKKENRPEAPDHVRSKTRNQHWIDFLRSTTVPPEVWNRLGTKLLSKLRPGDDLSVGINFSVSISSQFAQNMEKDLQQILDELGLGDRVRVEKIPR